MLNATQATSVSGALQYYRAALAPGDYYLRSEVPGAWHGKAANLAGIKPGEAVTEAAFEALLQGFHPTTGKQLTQRHVQNRRPGIDLTFSIPKSATLAWALADDHRVLLALEEAVHETMTKDVEPLVCRRLRKGPNAATTNRQHTGNFLYASFTHKTSRPVGGLVDAHLHLHCFVMNLTADGDQMYAAELEEVMRRMPLLQAAFEARFARRLERELGYTIVRSRYRQSGRVKTGWEIAGLERSTLEKFSRRTLQIEEAALAKGIVDPKAKGNLGASTREEKQSGESIDSLRREWHSRLSPAERLAIKQLRQGAVAKVVDDSLRATAAIDFALEHHLYRNSTVERTQIIATALEHAITLIPEQIEAALKRSDVIQVSEDVRGMERGLVTTTEVLEAERQMIAYARDGRGTKLPISRHEYQFKATFLSKEQQRAVRHVIQSKDAVSAIAGGAGTGKSTLMQEAAIAIREAGKPLYVFAPSTGACDVLKEKGFENANTVEHLLRNTRLHPELKDSVLWVDEAGLLDVRSMNGVFEIAKAQNARVVLSGDTRQHASPRRGQALVLCEKFAGLNVARVEQVRRQQGEYKRAIELVSRGHEVVDPQTGLTGMLAGFDLLASMGKVVELDAEDRHAMLADRYIQAHQQGQSTLVVSPTHAEGQAVTAEIRHRLRQAGAIGGEERVFTQLKSLNLSEAEKGEPSTYLAVGNSDEPLVLQFHQNVPGGFVRGERYRVVQGEGDTIYLAPLTSPSPEASTQKPLPTAYASRFEVYRETQVAFAPGDKLRISLGGTTIDGRRVSNGRLDEVAGFDRAGNVLLKSGFTISANYGHWDHGFVITSHASQGKDVDLVIASMGRESLPAVHSKQFYVSMSRGRRDVILYTDDKEAVRRAIQVAGEQLSATELAERHRLASQQQSLRQAQRLHRDFVERVRRWWRPLRPVPAALHSPTPLMTRNSITPVPRRI